MDHMIASAEGKRMSFAGSMSQKCYEDRLSEYYISHEAAGGGGAFSGQTTIGVWDGRL